MLSLIQHLETDLYDIQYLEGQCTKATILHATDTAIVFKDEQGRVKLIPVHRLKSITVSRFQ